MPKIKNDAFMLGSLKDYYLNMNERPKLYLDVYKITEAKEFQFTKYQVSPETLVVLQALYSSPDFGKWVDVNLVVTAASSSVSVKVNVDLDDEKRKLFQVLNLKDSTEEITITNKSNFSIQAFDRPSIAVPENRIILSGLPAVLRFLLKLVSIKDTYLESEFGNLLGFRGGCLQACSESSIWTKFCEVDMIKRMLSSLVIATDDFWKEVDGSRHFYLPEDLLRLEYHLSQPVKIHNFRKTVHQQRKAEGKENVQNCNNESIGEIPHDFAEGPSMTLADLILFPCVELALARIGSPIFQNHLPNVLAWRNRVRERGQSTTCMTILPAELKTHYNDKPPISEHVLGHGEFRVELPNIPKESLYKSDTSRYNPKLRLFTKQEDIEESLKVLSDAGIDLKNPDKAEDGMSGLDEVPLDWTKIPPLAQPGPDGGKLPEARQEKKAHQLANLVQMVQFLYTKYEERGSRDIRIVDFCSGGGHLGILIGLLLPKANVLLVENKEESLRRARERVEALGLTNISFAQCNLTRFHGMFEIGVGLHACGSATDLILSKCVQNQASFVVCPCCYGGIQCGGEVGRYPRSESFLRAAGMTLEKYLVLAHSADQTHEEGHEKTGQGRISMRAVDTDRLKAFGENGYRTWLRRIVPSTATPKNHILVGLAP